MIRVRNVEATIWYIQSVMQVLVFAFLVCSSSGSWNVEIMFSSFSPSWNVEAILVVVVGRVEKKADCCSWPFSKLQLGPLPWTIAINVARNVYHEDHTAIFT